MAAVPIYVWNGTAWQETGPTIPASPIKYQTTAPTSPSTGDIWIDSDADVTTGSQQFQRFRFVASGGETSVSGVDANGATLAYTAGTEIVVLNGSTLVRGQDYTATTGSSITGLSPALVASDVLEVFSFMAFNVANTYTQSEVDGITKGPAFRAYISTNQLVSHSTWVKLSFNSESFDTHGCFDSSTNYRFTPTVAGYYQINGKYFYNSASGAPDNLLYVAIYKNGSAYSTGMSRCYTNGQVIPTVSDIVYFNGSTDYVELYAYLATGINGNTGTDTSYNIFSGCLIRRG